MVSPINSLMNMEYMLYGGTLGANTSCPSFANGYRANNLSFYGNNTFGMSPYYTNNSAFNGGWNTTGINQGVNQGVNRGINQGASNTIGNKVATEVASKDLNTLGDYYIKGLNPTESIMGAAVGGAAFEIFNNMRFIAHPWNSFTTIGKVEKAFRTPEAKALWANKENYNLMRDAYARMHKLEGGAKRRLGLFKQRIDKTTYDALKSEMEAAIKSGNKEAIATATEKIRVATNAKTGYIPRGFNSVKKVLNISESVVAESDGLLTKLCKNIKNTFAYKPLTAVADKIANTGSISQAVSKNMTEKYATKTFAQHLIHDLKGPAGLGGLIFAGMEFFFDRDKISAAFKESDSNGWKQLGQTSVKAAGSIAGWSAGSAAGTWAGAKLGALAGSAIAPGVGTLIGAVAGAVGGTIGCNLMGKLTHKIVDKDVGTEAEVKNMKKTPQGQAQLLSLTLQQAQEDKNLDPKVALALQNLATQYA